MRSGHPRASRAYRPSGACRPAFAALSRRRGRLPAHRRVHPRAVQTHRGSQRSHHRAGAPPGPPRAPSRRGRRGRGGALRGRALGEVPRRPREAADGGAIPRGRPPLADNGFFVLLILILH